MIVERKEVRVLHGAGIRVDLDAHMEWKETPTPHQTIEHVECLALVEFTFAWQIFERRAGRWEETGWHRDRLDLDAIDGLAWQDGWDEARVERIAVLGGEWHLNGLQAACAHQAVVWDETPYRQPSLDRTMPCPTSGYRYGTAWLARPMPPEIEAELRSLCAIPDEEGRAP